jgi:hypothetical protein
VVPRDLRGPSSPPDQLQIHEYGRIPVVEGGRVKPMDSVARNHLRIMAERETFLTPEEGEKSAIEWLLDVQTEMFSDRDQRARKHRVFRIVNEQLQSALGLDPKRDRYRYSIDEFAEKLTTLAEPLRKAHERKESGHALDPYENQLFEFERHLGIYQRLSQFATPHVIPPKTGDHYLTLPGGGAEGRGGHGIRRSPPGRRCWSPTARRTPRSSTRP